MSLDRTLQRVWYERSPRVLFLALTPLSAVFAILAGLRRAAYRIGLLRVVRVAKPVIVVGNITVGGTGKTPLVIWVAQVLREQGVKVGVITRGYEGSATRWPQDVTRASSPATVGDEAVLIATRTDAIVIAGPDRVSASQRAIALGAQVIVSDDGLQHYRLARDAEIVVMDAVRGEGNGWLLPAGPLRERSARIRTADVVIFTQRQRGGRQSARGDSVVAHHEVREAQCIRTGETRPLASFAGAALHAVAGIGNPDAFFTMLREHGLVVNARALPDHAAISAADIDFEGTAPVLMTEKDAVKCAAIATERHWVVRLEVRFSDADAQWLSKFLARIAASRST